MNVEDLDEWLEDIGYIPAKWRKMLRDKYRQAGENVKFFELTGYIPFTGPKIKITYPWEGQRP